MFSYVEVYYDVWTVRVCSCVYCDSLLWNIFWCTWQSGVKIPSYVELYDYVKVYCGSAAVLCVYV